MKKIISIMLVVAMLMSFGTAVFAEEYAADITVSEFKSLEEYLTVEHVDESCELQVDFEGYFCNIGENCIIGIVNNHENCLDWYSNDGEITTPDIKDVDRLFAYIEYRMPSGEDTVTSFKCNGISIPESDFNPTAKENQFKLIEDSGYYKKGNALIAFIELPLPNTGEKSGKAEITAKVEHSPEYTIHIPSNTALQQDVETAQELTDSVYVSGLKYMDGKKVTCTPSGENLKLDGETEEITTTYSYKTLKMDSASAFAKFDCDVKTGSEDSFVGTKIFATVAKADWENATAGSYSATVTFKFAVEEDKKFKTVADIIATVENITGFKNSNHTYLDIED